MAINNFYVLGAVGVAGVVGGGVYLAYPSSTPTQTTTKTVVTIRDKLKKDKYTLLGRGNSAGDTVLEKYNLAKDTPDKRFTVSTDAVDVNSLKKDCKLAIDQEGNDSLYEKVKHWCTVPRNIQERLKDLGINVLKTSGEGEAGDQSKGTKLKDLYKNAGENGIKSFTISNPEGVDAWKKLRSECEKHLNKDKGDVDYDYYLGKVSDGCSDKG